jgi:hypothetical protein
MGKIEKYIDKIVEKGIPEDMDKLSDMLEDLIYELKETNHKEYKHYKMCLYEMAYGKVLNEEMAHEIVEHMKPYGEHWTMEDTTGVKNQYGLSNINEIDFYVVMNSAYNDYHEMFDEDLEQYVKYTKLFIEDKDAKKGKVFTYFMYIPEKD